MPPKDILLDLFQRQVTPWLQAQGFRFSRSQFSYKKRVKEFTQQIMIFLDRRNSSIGMEFDSGFSVSSPEYNRWLRAQGRPESDGVICGCPDWNIPDWYEPGDLRTWVDFTEPFTRYVVVEEWKERCERVGLKFLEQLCSWKGAAEHVRNQCQYDHAADFFLIAGDVDRCIASLEEGIQCLKAQDVGWSEHTHPILIKKKRRQAAQRDAEVALYLERIRALEKSEHGAGLNDSSASLQKRESA